MEINCKLTFNIPEELIDALGISEDTVFETYYHGIESEEYIRE